MVRRATIAIALTWSVVLGLVAMVGCSGETNGPLAVAEAMGETEERVGLISLVLDEGMEPGAYEMEVSGYFMEIYGVDKGALFSFLNLPPLTEAPAGDTCVIVHRDYASSLPATQEDDYVDLLDIGDLRIFFDGKGYQITSEYIPEIFSFLRGTRYQSIWGITDPVPLITSKIRVTNTDNIEMSKFGIDVYMPLPIALEPLPTTTVGTMDAVQLSLDTGSTLEWNVPDTGTHVMLVEVVKSGYDEAGILRCTVEDDGAFTLPGDLVDELGALGPGEVGTLALSRYSLWELHPDGLDACWIVTGTTLEEPAVW